jgi:HEPN domain-containing protein
VGIADEIFPSKARRDHVQTQWSPGWTGTAMGFGEAARFLTENRQRSGASIDSVGPVVFFIQRHRMEVAMKELLIFRGTDIPRSHSLTTLWHLCAQAIGPRTEEWRHMDELGTELVALIDSHDPDSQTFRYPVGLDGEPHHRPAIIDLEALEEHVEKFVSNLTGYEDYVSEGRRIEQEARAGAAYEAEDYI